MEFTKFEELKGAVENIYHTDRPAPKHISVEEFTANDTADTSEKLGINDTLINEQPSGGK